MYDSLADIPAEEYLIPDKDDYPSENRPTADFNDALAIASTAIKIKKPGHKFIPYSGLIKGGSRGTPAIAVKRALTNAGYRKDINIQLPVFGIFAERQLKKFQHDHGLPPNGKYTRQTHRALMPFYDLRSIYLLTHRYYSDIIEDKNRAQICAAAWVGYMHRVELHYTQSALRMDGVRHHIKLPNYPHYEDCSSFSTWTYWQAGVPDPNGNHYNLEGYTGTLQSHGSLVAWNTSVPGNLRLYGNKGGISTHVAIDVGNGKVISHGSEAGPYFLISNYRPDANQVRSYL